MPIQDDENLRTIPFEEPLLDREYIEGIIGRFDSFLDKAKANSLCAIEKEALLTELKNYLLQQVENEDSSLSYHDVVLIQHSDKKICEKMIRSLKRDFTNRFRSWLQDPRLQALSKTHIKDFLDQHVGKEMKHLSMCEIALLYIGKEDTTLLESITSLTNNFESFRRMFAPNAFSEEEQDVISRLFKKFMRRNQYVQLKDNEMSMALVGALLGIDRARVPEKVLNLNKENRKSKIHKKVNAKDVMQKLVKILDEHIEKLGLTDKDLIGFLRMNVINKSIRRYARDNKVDISRLWMKYRFSLAKFKDVNLE